VPVTLSSRIDSIARAQDLIALHIRYTGPTLEGPSSWSYSKGFITACRGVCELELRNRKSTQGDHTNSNHSDDRLGDFTTDFRVVTLTLMATIIGAVSAFVAFALVWLIGVITNLSFYFRFSSSFASPDGNHLGYWVILVPMVGGLIVGLMAYFGSEKIRGHGIPEALEAILIGRSRIEAKVAILKPVSSAIAIGTGGPFGAEGPIIMTGGAIGSLLAQFFHLSAAERKTLLVAGAAGGMAAIFSAPLAAVLIAVELMLFEWKPRSFIPVAFSAVIASAVRIPLLGHGPIFPVTPHGDVTASQLALCLVAGLVAGVASIILTNLVYRFEDLFSRLPLHWMWWPLIGGLFVGIGGLIDPRVMGVGYDNIHGLLLGKILGGAIVGLLIGKALVWAIALGSGTSGGVLAPLLMIGGALGALEAHIIPVGDPGFWAAISMAAVMGGTMGAPFTAIVFTLELTHDFNLLPGLLLACIASAAVTVLTTKRSILTEKVARHGHHIMREYAVDPLEAVRVQEVMDGNVSTIVATMTVAELSDRIARGDPQLTRRQGTPIVDEDGKLVGIITRGDVLRAIGLDRDGPMTVLEAGSSNLILAYPDELLREAVTKMVQNNIGRLPVVSRDNPDHLLGYLGRAAVMAARLRLHQEESVRERTWGGRDRKPDPRLVHKGS
jgi:CIC family chloride channel protein